MQQKQFNIASKEKIFQKKHRLSQSQPSPNLGQNLVKGGHRGHRWPTCQRLPAPPPRVTAHWPRVVNAGPPASDPVLTLPPCLVFPPRLVFTSPPRVPTRPPRLHPPWSMRSTNSPRPPGVNAPGPLASDSGAGPPDGSPPDGPGL